MTHMSPQIYLGSQKECDMCMNPILRLLDHSEGLNWPNTCLVGVVPTFVSWLMGGDRSNMPVGV
jgi:hypothetical protein